jgi:hypothetical protein
VDLDHAADARVRMVEIHRDRIVLRRAVRGIKMAVSLPITVYLGVAIRMRRAAPNSAGAVVIVLEQADPALSVTLSCATEVGDSIADWRSCWRSWGRALDMRFWSRAPTGGCASRSSTSVACASVCP